MICNYVYQEAQKHNSMKMGHTSLLDLNKVQKPSLDEYMNQISLKSVQGFERIIQVRNVFNQDCFFKIVNLGHSNLISTN